MATTSRSPPGALSDKAPTGAPAWLTPSPEAKTIAVTAPTRATTKCPASQLAALLMPDATPA